MMPSESPNGSARSSPSHSRNSSVSQSRSGNNQHVPSNPSGLRNSHMPPESPEDKRIKDTSSSSGDDSSVETSRHLPAFEQDGIHPTNPDHASLLSDEQDTHQEGTIESGIQPDMRTRLLDQSHWDRASGCGSDSCGHGTFSPRPQLGRNYGSISTVGSDEGFGGRHTGDEATEELTNGHGEQGKMSLTKWLARRHGVRNLNLMYVGARQASSCIGADQVTIGTYSTTYPSAIGYHSIDGPMSKATLLRRSQWLLSTFPCLFPTPRILLTFLLSMVSTPLSSIHSSTPFSEHVHKWW